MENNIATVQPMQESKGSVIGGIIGAFLGASIGAVVWAIVGMLGYIASIVGFVIAFLADKGYDLLKGRQGVLKMIVLIICVVAAVFAGTIGTAVWQIHNEYDALSDFEKQYQYPAESEVIKIMLQDDEVQSAILKDSAMGLVFGIMGSIGLIINAKKGKKTQPAPQTPSITPSATDENTSSNPTDTQF